MNAHKFPAARIPLSGSKTAGVVIPSPLAAPATPIGAASSRTRACGETAHGPTGEAGAPNLSTLPKVACTECGGEGEDWWIALDSREYRLEDCPYCDGTGLVEPNCMICEGKLSPEGFCADCDCSLTDFVVTVSPDGTARISA